MPNDPPLDLDTQDKDILIADEYITQDDGKYAVGPDEARERAVSNKMYKLEQKHAFANTQFFKHFTQLPELLEPTAKDAQAKVKLADKMLMLPALFDGEKPEKAKTHYEKFNQHIRFQTKESNIKDTTKEAIELFEHTLNKKGFNMVPTT